MRLPDQLEGGNLNTTVETSRITDRIEQNITNRSVPQVLQGLYDLASLGNPELIRHTYAIDQIRQRIYGDNNLGALLDLQLVRELRTAEQRRDQPSIRRLIEVARILQEPYEAAPIKNS